MLALLVAGCGSQEDPMNDRGYYPLKVGSYWIYDVQKTNYISVSSSEEIQFQLLVEIVDSFVNSQDENTYVIHRSVRPSASDSWDYVETWSVRANEIHLIESEGNANYIKLVFPLYLFRSWDSNSLNSNTEDEFFVSEKGITYDLGNGTRYRSCVVITQEDIYTPVLQDTRSEVYSANVGLVYKERIVIDFDTSDEAIGLYIPASGVSYVQRLIDYGEN